MFINVEGIKMQQRFCQCGFSVWVQYLINETLCRVRFWNNAGGCGPHLAHCPGCMRRLRIDELR